MTAINKAIKEAKSGATEVVIRSKDVRTFAEHFRMLSVNSDSTTDDIASGIKAGRLRLLGVPVRVEE